MRCTSLRNWSTDVQLTTSSGSEFHNRIASGKKVCWNTSVLANGTMNFCEWPLCDILGAVARYDGGMPIKPWTIWNIITALNWALLSRSVGCWSSCSIGVKIGFPCTPWIYFFNLVFKNPYGVNIKNQNCSHEKYCPMRFFWRPFRWPSWIYLKVSIWHQLYIFFYSGKQLKLLLSAI